MKIVHVITGLHVGGAETMLLKLLRTMDRDRFTPTVVALLDGGPVADQVRDLGIPVYHLGLRTPLHGPLVGWRLHRLGQELAPDVVQGWMYHGNLAATVLAGAAPGRPELFWNIRHTLPDLGQERPLTRALIRWGGRWSTRPRAVVHNATVSIAQHAAVGFDPHRAVMIPNGFDLDTFRPDPAAGARLRTRLGLAPDTVLVGNLGRRHPVKGHDVLLAAAAQVAANHPAVHFVLAGRGVTTDDPGLAQLSGAPELAGRVHLLGPENAPAEFLAGLDLYCLASHGEGFPNVLGEAMACGVPCVTTDVGEAAVIVGDSGPVVPPGDAAALAEALDRALARLEGQDAAARATVGRACRASIADRYSLAAIAGLYAELYRGKDNR